MKRLYRLKPSRSIVSLTLLAMGILIVVGIFVIMPNNFIFGILWVLFMGAIAALIIHQYRVGIVVESESTTDGDGHMGTDIGGKLRNLEYLKKQNLISDEEYEEKREEILNSF